MTILTLSDMTLGNILINTRKAGIMETIDDDIEFVVVIQF